MTDSQRTEVTAAKALEAIGLNDPTIVALLKELKENAMTDEERKRLCRKLRNPGADYSPNTTANQAADEIEQLQGENDWLRTALRAAQTSEAQSDAEPVAWRLVPIEPTAEMCDAGRAFFPDSMDKNDIYARPVWQAMLAVAPPRPDASEIEQLKAELHTTWQRRLENNRLAYQWMERHDKVCGYIAENYPSVMLPNLPFPPPVARPDASAGLIEAAVRAAFEEAAQIADSFGDRHAEYEPGDAIRARAAERLSEIYK